MGASYLYFTGEMARVAEVATASIDYGQGEHKKPAETKATLGVKAALLPMAVFHQMTPPTKYRHFVKRGFPTLLHFSTRRHHHHQP